jgi:hypothetical protein
MSVAAYWQPEALSLLIASLLIASPLRTVAAKAASFYMVDNHHIHLFGCISWVVVAVWDF